MSTVQQPGEILHAWLKRVYRERLTQKFDTVVLVIGGEGVGKSTCMLELITRYFQIRGREPEDVIDAILDRVVWSTREEFKEHLANDPTRSAIAVPDAARVMHKKEAMVGEQREIEKDMLDVRTKEFFLMFGYQDWSVVPSLLQERRAHFCLYIPRRGEVEVFGRDKLDEKLDLGRDEWPDPDFVDRFPDLSSQAPELWEAYEEADMEAKNERMQADTGPDPEEVQKQQQIKTAIRAVKLHGMTYREAASLVDYSKEWVGDKYRDFRDGQLNSLFEDDEMISPPDPSKAR